MTCDGCGEAPRYMLYEHQEPHCEDCYRDALDGCTKPFLIMTYEAWEMEQRKIKRELRESA